MRIHNLYTDAKGESHFRDIEVEWTEERRGSKMSKKLPATGVIFRETAAEHNVDWHPAPRRQYIVNLDAGVKITASDGEARFIAAGEVILVEDTTGKGHLSDHIEGKIRHSIFIPDRVAAPRVPGEGRDPSLNSSVARWMDPGIRRELGAGNARSEDVRV